MPIHRPFVVGVSADSKDKICNGRRPIRTHRSHRSNTDRKTSILASRSNRRRGGQASPTCHAIFPAEAGQPRMTLGVRRTRRGFTPLHVRSERSPLHDVRQHARRNDALEGVSRNAISCFHGRVRKSIGITAGGARRNRTDDLLLAKQALSQLSYGPAQSAKTWVPSTSGKWWAWEDLNFRPHAYQARALTN